MTTPKNDSGKTKRDLIVTSILLVVFAFLLTKNILLKKKQHPTVAGVAAPVTRPVSDERAYVANLRSFDTLREEQRKVWEKEWVRDPFTPPADISSIARAATLALKGVLWDPDHPKAIVNDRTLVKGDTLYGYTVVDIRPRSVLLRAGEKNIELSVFGAVAVDS